MCSMLLVCSIGEQHIIPMAIVTERVNPYLKAMLIKHTERHRDWDAKMAFATRMTINHWFHSGNASLWT